MPAFVGEGVLERCFYGYAHLLALLVRQLSSRWYLLAAWAEAFAYTQLVECPVYYLLLEPHSHSHSHSQSHSHHTHSHSHSPRSSASTSSAAASRLPSSCSPLLCGFAASALTHPLATLCWWAAQWSMLPWLLGTSHVDAQAPLSWAVWVAIELAVCIAEASWASRCGYCNGAAVSAAANAASCAAAWCVLRGGAR